MTLAKGLAMKNVPSVLARYTTGFFRWIVFTSLSLIVAIVFVQIFFRYVLGRPLFWSEELAKFFFPWLIFSGAALASRGNSHIKIDFFADRFSEKWRSVVNRLVQICAIVFSFLVILYTIPLAQSQWDVKSTALYIPLNYFSLSVVIGLVGIIVYTVGGTRERKE
jgi:TRAP-type C4-dicarboxylate transport system permease small subunit